MPGLNLKEIMSTSNMNQQGLNIATYGQAYTLPGLPLTQVAFDVSVEIPETNGTSEKAFAYFPGWKLPGGSSDFMSSNLF